mmetsp:Transcript_28242/g.40443  ORF Transcript_28242/g.40443 Transcript_28242/m.40443 type:complete len:203 (-) Transcript_28242:36-644(-)
MLLPMRLQSARHWHRLQISSFIVSRPRFRATRFIVHPKASNLTVRHFLGTSSNGTRSDSFSSLPQNKRKKFIPIKAAVNLTPKLRNYLKLLIENYPKGKEKTKGIMLHYEQGSDGTPRMVFTFKFLTSDFVADPMDEAVSLEVLEDGITPKLPRDAINDGLSKLYINQHCLLKVLGSTVDVDDQYNILLRDAEGNILDPNNS